MTDHRRLSAEERARDLIRRGLPLPLAGHLCEPESCAVPDLERCPWPFTVMWRCRDGWGDWVYWGPIDQAPTGMVAPLCGYTYQQGRNDCPEGRHAYSMDYARYLLTIKGERITRRRGARQERQHPRRPVRVAREGRS